MEFFWVQFRHLWIGLKNYFNVFVSIAIPFVYWGLSILFNAEKKIQPIIFLCACSPCSSVCLHVYLNSQGMILIFGIIFLLLFPCTLR